VKYDAGYSSNSIPALDENHFTALGFIPAFFRRTAESYDPLDYIAARCCATAPISPGLSFATGCLLIPPQPPEKQMRQADAGDDRNFEFPKSIMLFSRPAQRASLARRSIDSDRQLDHADRRELAGPVCRRVLGFFRVAVARINKQPVAKLSPGDIGAVAQHRAADVVKRIVLILQFDGKCRDEAERGEMGFHRAPGIELLEYPAIVFSP